MIGLASRELEVALGAGVWGAGVAMGEGEVRWVGITIPMNRRRALLIRS